MAGKTEKVARNPKNKRESHFYHSYILFQFIQVQESLAPKTADPQGNWHDCKSNNERCSSSQIQFLQGK